MSKGELVGRVDIGQKPREAIEQFAVQYFSGTPQVKRVLETERGYSFTINKKRYEIRRKKSWYDVYSI